MLFMGFTSIFGPMDSSAGPGLSGPGWRKTWTRPRPNPELTRCLGRTQPNSPCLGSSRARVEQG